MDWHSIRGQFPMIAHHPNVAYLDSAASAFTPRAVIEKVNYYYTTHNTNVSRGVDQLVYQTTCLYEAVRQQVQQFIHARYADEIIFTRGATDSLNMVAFGFAQHILQPNDEIILNIAEHHANLIPWQEIAQRTDAKIVYVDLDESGAIDQTHLVSLLSDKTKIVAFAHMTNILGSFNDPAQICQLVKQHSQAFCVVDGAQGIVHHPIDVQQCDCDFYAFSGHKMYGPTGVGVLYGKSALLEQMKPVMFGGDMVDLVTKTSSTYRDAPYKFETGTMMIAQVMGLGAAIDFVQSIPLTAKHEYIGQLRAYAIAELSKLSNIVFYNKENTTSSTISFNLSDVHAHDAASVFSDCHVVIRAGHHCAQLLLERLEATSSLRMSIEIYNTKEDIDKFIDAAKKAGDFLDVLFK